MRDSEKTEHSVNPNCFISHNVFHVILSPSVPQDVKSHFILNFHLLLNLWRSFQFSPNALSHLEASVFVLLPTRLCFASRVNLKIPRESARLSKTCLFPVRAVVINLHSTDSSVIFAAALLCFSRFSSDSHTAVFGKWQLNSTWAWKIVGVLMIKDWSRQNGMVWALFSAPKW